jgi:uncharacterized protein (UPF0335 family)
MSGANRIIVDGVAGDILKQYIERIEHLEQEKAEVMERMKDVYSAAKSDGLEPKVMRLIIRIRKMKPEDLDEQEALIEVYKKALGMEHNL